MKSADGSLLHGPCIDTIYESDLDEENNSGSEAPALLERRRKLHTEAEQRRRNSIKMGFQALLELVHPVKNGVHSSSIRMSKSTILQKSINAIEKTERQINQKLAEVENLDLQVQTLRILNSCYEKYAHGNSEAEAVPVTPISEDTKLQVFQMFSDSLFNSFDAMVKLAPMQEFSGSIINWIETNCKPERLSQLMQSVLDCTLNGSADSSSNYFPLCENPVKRMSNVSGMWVNQQTNGDWANPSTRLMVTGQSSHNWVPIPTDVTEASASTSRTSSAHRYGSRMERTGHEAGASHQFDRSRATMVGPSNSSDNTLKPDFTVSTYPLNVQQPQALAPPPPLPPPLPSGSSSSSQALISSTCCLPEMDISTEEHAGCFVSSQQVVPDQCFRPHSSVMKFDCDYSGSHSIAVVRPPLFNTSLTNEDCRNPGVTGNDSTQNNNLNLNSATGNHSGNATTNDSPNSPFGSGNSNNVNNNLSIPNNYMSSNNNVDNTFRPRFAYTTESLNESAGPVNRALLGPRRSVQLESPRVRYKQFF